MNDFAALVDRLYYLNSNNAKAELLIEYLRNTPDPDRGWAIGAIAGTLNFEFFKRRVIKDLIVERIDPVLFDLSYDYVGEMSETVAHLWSTVKEDKALTQSEIWADCVQNQALPSLAQVVDKFTHLPKNKVKPALIDLLNVMTPTQRWALLKLGTKGLRIGVSARFLKKILAQYSQQYIKVKSANLVDANSVETNKQLLLIDIESVERVWHGVQPPYIDLLAWLEQKAPMPDITNKLTFQPVMLAHPIDEQELNSITPEQWQAEWKFDGIRAQLVVNDAGSAIFSRTGDDISGSFPDLIAHIAGLGIKGRFDGELLALNPDMLDDTEAKVNKSDYDFSHIASFNQLQQRLNKKKPSKALMQSTPVGLIIYDALQIEEHDLREQALHKRTKAIGDYLTKVDSAHLVATQTVPFSSPQQLSDLKQEVSTHSNGYIEGLMLKHKQGNYVAGRPKGQWYKLKRDPKLIDAVIMYAQRGHGKRSSYYSDFTFGCWQDQQLLPIGKAYSGFTDEELKKLDNWVRKNTIGRFGPVKEVKKELVFEVAFDAVQSSNRHKSKVALRFPRIHRIRWDKPATEADELANLINLID